MGAAPVEAEFGAFQTSQNTSGEPIAKAVKHLNDHIGRQFFIFLEMPHPGKCRPGRIPPSLRLPPPLAK